MVENEAPVPVEGDPLVAVQVNVYGLVPPVADAVHATAVPTVPVAGQLMLAASVSGLIVTVAEPEAVFELVSVTTTEIVSVPLVE